MELQQLKYFKDAAKYENFSSAAKQNYVPQPSISKAVKNLEVELGVSLFNRKGKKIFLNDNGRYLYENTIKIFDILDDCSKHFSNYRSNVTKIYIQEGMFLIPKLVADFSKENTNTSILYLSASEVLEAKKSPYDFTFIPGHADLNNYNYVHLLEDELVLLVSEQHPFADRELVKLEELKNEKFVSYYPTISHRVLSDKLCREVGNFLPNYVTETHDEYIVLHLVSTNLGVTLVPRKIYQSRPYNNVKSINLDKTIPCQLYIAWDKDKLLSSEEKSFLEFTKKWFEKI